MTPSETTGFVLGTLAVLFWSPHYYATVYAVAGETPLLVFYLHVLAWAAIACGVVLAATGRLDQLSVFKRRETRFLLLALTGGYGFWMLRALALDRAGDAPFHAHILFYTAPLLLGVLTLPRRGGARWKQIGALALGFVGSIMIIAPPGGEQVQSLLPVFGVGILGVGAALCWAVFCLLARPLVRKEKVLPSSFIIWTAGTACLLATCLSTGENPLNIAFRDVWLSMLLGAGTVALGFGVWLKCLAEVTPSFAAPLWYISLVFGIGWAHWMADVRPGWLTVGGVVLILLFARSGRSRDRRHSMTLSDVIRG